MTPELGADQDGRLTWNGAPVSDPGLAGAGHNRLAAIVPEKLLDVTPDEIPALLDLHYAELRKRGLALAVASGEWMFLKDYIGGQYMLTSDADMSDASARYKQLQSFVDECAEARSKVGMPLYRVKQGVDGWFNGVAELVRSSMILLDGAQKARLKRLADEARVEQQKAFQEAQQKAKLALEAAQKDAQRLDEALAAEQAAADAEAQTAVPLQETTRVHSALGITTSGSERYDFKIVDKRELLLAIANGEAPPNFVVTDDAVIKKAINGKHRLTSVPGLEITKDIAVNRRGRV